MAVLSRLADRAGLCTVHAECRDLTHPWNPDCLSAIADVVPRSLLYSLKTYALFYAFAYGLRHLRKKKVDWRQYVKDTLRSTVFLTSNMCLYFYMTCLLRRLVGAFTWPHYYIAGIVGSYLSIIQEQTRRRPVLALYLLNLASESLFYQLRNRGLVSNIPNAQAIIFSIGLGIIFFLKSKGISTDLQGILKKTHQLDAHDKINPRNLHPFLRSLIAKLRNDFTRGGDCPHKHSCLSNSATVNFSYGLGASILLATLKSLKRPRDILRNIFSTKTLNIPVFAALLPTLYHTVKCSLTRGTSLRPEQIQTAAGFSSGAAMLAFPNTTVAMYVLWQAIERLYHLAADNSLAPRFKHGDILVYSLATGYIVGNCIVEPHAIRPGYLEFIRGVTVNHVDYQHRHLLAPFGFESDKLFKELPRYMKFCSEGYQSVK